MPSPTLNPFLLLGQTLPLLPKLYRSLLILSSPTLALSLLSALLPSLESPLSLAYSLSVAPILTAASLLLIDRQLKRQPIGVATALQLAIATFADLFSASLFMLIIVFLGILALVIPGLYIGLALIFVINAIVLVDASRLNAAPPIPLIDGLAASIARNALGATRYSWQLVTPRWFSVFAAHLGLGLCLLIPFIIGVLAIVGITISFGSTTLAEILTAVLVILLLPIYLVWDYLLFRSLEQL